MVEGVLALKRPVRQMALAGCVALALIIMIAGTTTAFEITQPPDGSHVAVTPFEVQPGETGAAVAARLEHAGLIRSAWLFERVAHLPARIAPGVYRLSPAMNMNTVASKLASGHPDAEWIIIPPGLRVAQYPQLFAGRLPHVQAQALLTIATSGSLPDGTALSSRYWYVVPKGPQVNAALEGYLFPGTYLIDTAADASAVVNQLLGALGNRLCPGPDAAHRDVYRHDAAQCKTHAAKVGTGATTMSIFAAMEQRFATSDDRLALYDTLTLASIVEREAATPDDAAHVAGVYDNRYLAARTNAPDPAGDVVGYLDASSTAQYARESDQSPANGRWWEPLTQPGASTAPDNAYNTMVASHVGLPPGPIAAPDWTAISAAATANMSRPTPDYFVANICSQMAYATSAAENQGMQVKARYEAAHNCRSPLLAIPSSAAAHLPAAPATLPAAQPAPATSAAADVLLDPDTGQVYAAQNGDAERAMASTTKMMTALVAITYGNLDQRITVGQDIAQLAGTGASVAYLRPGDELTLRELLYGLMLPSGDDAAIVIADGVAGSQAGFIYLMNDEARLLGLSHTHYTNVHGLDDKGHYSSAVDLARLAGFALRDATFANVVSTPTYMLAATTDHQAYLWQNTNELLLPPAYPGILGVKTGFTGAANYCLVFAARGPSGMLVGVVLGEPTEASRFSDGRALLDWGFTAQARVNWLLRHAGVRAA